MLFGWPDCYARFGQKQSVRLGQMYNCGWKELSRFRSSRLRARSLNASVLPDGQDQVSSGRPLLPDLQGIVEPSSRVALARSPGSVALKVFSKTLQCLLISPRCPDTMDSTIGSGAHVFLAPGQFSGKWRVRPGLWRIEILARFFPYKLSVVINHFRF